MLWQKGKKDTQKCVHEKVFKTRYEKVKGISMLESDFKLFNLEIFFDIAKFCMSSRQVGNLCNKKITR